MLTGKLFMLREVAKHEDVCVKHKQKVSITYVGIRSIKQMRMTYYLYLIS